MDSLHYYIGFNLVQGIGPIRLRALIDAFGDVERAWHAPADALRHIGLDQRSRQSFLTTRAQVDLAREVERVKAAGVQVLTWDTPGYPQLLWEIPAPPPVLFIRGELAPEDAWAVAVVGTRRASVYGRDVTQRLVTTLTRQGVTIVSGLARGIDGAAHQAALEAGGRTIAVLGCGVDQVYPPEHRRLARQIVEQGALISEYALGTPPEAGNFPPRNRIISGLSLGVLITEAGRRSGALITAHYAAEQGRDVFAVPGSILAAGSAGTNRLIQDGAKAVLEANDVLEELNLTMVAEQSQARQVLPTTQTEAALLTQLGTEPVHVDELQQQVGLTIAEVTSTLAMMELKGMIRQVGGMKYVVAREQDAEYIIE
ncbi:MAG: DNA-processing protein DprA [Anaerolineae bacterium]|nr:DNA-processing protein DprA [Anaerolineae bacterium]